MINILLNGKSIEVATACTLALALPQWGYGALPFAVAIDQVFVPSVEYANTLLQEGMMIEVLSPMQGG